MQLKLHNFIKHTELSSFLLNTQMPKKRGGVTVQGMQHKSRCLSFNLNIIIKI